MNNMFSFERFMRLLRAQWAESYRQYAWFIGVSAIIDIIFFIIIFKTDFNYTFHAFQYGGQVGWYTAGLFMAGGIFAGLYFKQLSDPGSALISLMRPASIFEKWLMAIVIVSMLFPLVYTVFYCLLNFPAVQIAKLLYVVPQNCKDCTADFSFFLPFITTGDLTNNSRDAIVASKIQFYTLVLFWITQALMLNGTVFFKRSPILRTVLILFLLSIILMNFLPKPPIKPFWSSTTQELMLYSIFEIINSFAAWIAPLILLWLALYYHLKEREVT